MRLLPLIGLAAVVAGPAYAQDLPDQFFYAPQMTFGQFVASVTPPTTIAPSNIVAPEVAGLDFPNDSVHTTLSGTATTLSANQGKWTGALSLSNKWHTVNAPGVSLGTGPTLTIDTAATPALVGQAIELDVTAANLTGSTKVTSHWFGPIETAVPVAPVALENSVIPAIDGSFPLPVSPANFLQNGHAVYPGCPIPPTAPDTSNPSTVWFVDPVAGQTMDQMVTAGVPTSSMGHAGHPFASVSGLFSPAIGYGMQSTITSVVNTGTTGAFGTIVAGPAGFIVTVAGVVANVHSAITGPGGRVLFDIPSGVTATISNVQIYTQLWNIGSPVSINPGAVIELEAGSAGTITAGGEFSTVDGTPNTAPVWTWVMADPAATGRATLGGVNFTNGLMGFIFKGFNVEQYRSTNLVSTSGSAATPSQDNYFEGLHLSQWLGHSDDAWPGIYPNTEGQSDGTILTSSPTFTAGLEDRVVANATAAANSTTLTNLSAVPPMGEYVYSPGLYFIGPFVEAPGTGIPQGSMIKEISGLTASQFGFSGGTVTALLASQLTPLVEAPTSPLTSAPTVAVQGSDTTVFYRVAASGTVNQSIFTFNTGTGAWASLGTIPPAAPIIVNDVLLETINSHILHWTGAQPWVDQGILNATLGPCDPVADAATGCPTHDYVNPVTHATLAGVNVPGCDPILSLPGNAPLTGGCPGGTPVPYAGTTRALANELIGFTGAISIVPAGSWNYADWDGGSKFSVRFSGALQAAASDPDPTHPNVFVGSTCNSLKDATIREGSVAVQTADTNNTILYNNKIKYMSNDNFEPYSVNRLWIIHNFASDPALIWGHQDAVQFGDTNGRGDAGFGGCGTGAQCTDMLFSTDVTENEFVQRTDPTNFFPREFQCINTTEHNHWGYYIADNACVASTNGIGIDGPYNVIVNNVQIGSSMRTGWQPKGQPLFGSSHNFDLVANNISNGINRVENGNLLPFCDPTAGDLSTWESNFSVPFIGNTGALPGANSELCSNDATPVQVEVTTGNYSGVAGWTQTDWRSGATGPGLFKGYNPVAAPVAPQPGFQNQPLPPFHLCAQDIFGPPSSTCVPGTPGFIDFHPDATFAGFTGHLAVSLTPGNATGKPFDLPAATAGDFGMAPTSGSGTIPAGIWQFNPGCTPPAGTVASGSGSSWCFVSPQPSYNPAIIGKGTALGAQAPISDIVGNPWNSPPTPGVFENH